MKKSVIIVLGSLLLIVLGFNTFLKNPSFEHSNELINYAVITKQFQLAEDSFKKLIDTDSTNLDYYYGHITSHFKLPKKTKVSKYNYETRDDSYIFKLYNSKSKSPDRLQRDIGYYGLGLCYSIQNSYNTAIKHLDKVDNKNLKYLNNTLGNIHLKKENYDLATKFLIKEIENEGNLNGAYSNLINLYLKTNQLSKLNELIDRGKKDYFSKNNLNEYYFKSAKISKYISGIFSIVYYNLDFKSFLAALLIGIIWLIYLRKIDVFEPEKWGFVILTFVLGILFSYGTFIISDINQFVIGFTQNGEIFNDFLYCFIGIGLVEEIMKLIPFLLILKFTNEVDEPIDYIIYPSISALGFAFAENILYFHGLGLDIIHGRALISVVAHMICSSIIGYGLYFGIGSLNLKHWQKIIIFLLIAAFLHGFFDFWLINNKVNSFSIISLLLIIYGLTLWNSLINNTLNFSIPDNSTKNKLEQSNLQDYLIYGLSAVLIFEYTIVSMNYGVKVGNSSLLNAAYMGTYLIAFISTSLSKFNLRKNHKEKLLNNLSSFELDNIVEENIILRPTLRDKHNIFPLSGKIIERVIINKENDWYKVKLDNPIENFNVCKDYIFIKSRREGYMIRKKAGIEVGIYLIKFEYASNKEKYLKEDLLLVEWAYIV